MAELYNMDVLDKTNLKDSEKNENNSSAENSSKNDHGVEDIDDSELYFSPIKGNVVFASAYDGWGFNIQMFAEMLSSKLGMSYKALSQTLFGDYYITSKGGQKVILKGARDKKKQPLFVSLIMENIHNLYWKARLETSNLEEVRKIVNNLNIEISNQLLTTQTEYRERFVHIISNWLPLFKAVNDMVVKHIPSPLQMTEEKARKLLTTATSSYSLLPKKTKDLTEHFLSCSPSDSAPLIVYVSKMFGVLSKKLDAANDSLMQKLIRAGERESALAQTLVQYSGVHTNDDGTEEEDKEELIAFARVYSGNLVPGQEVYVLGPKHSPKDYETHIDEDGNLLPNTPTQWISKCKVTGVYTLLGREVSCLKVAKAGCVVGIRGLSNYIIKSGSLSSTVMCPPFTHVINSQALSTAEGMSTLQGSILQVSVRPKNPKHLGKLREGLKLLNKADPCVQVWLERSGEYMIGAAGEVHLQRCFDDLQDRYAKTELVKSTPRVPFRETIVPPPQVDRVNEAIEGENLNVNATKNDNDLECDGIVEQKDAMGLLRVRASPLPEEVTQILSEYSQLLRLVQSAAKHTNLSGSHNKKNLVEDLQESLEEPINNEEETDKCEEFEKQESSSPFKQDLSEENKNELKELKEKLNKAFEKAGPEWEGVVEQICSAGPNYSGANVLINREKSYKRPSMWDTESPLPPDSLLSPLDHSLIFGFQLFTSRGTLCEEPLRGVAFIIEKWNTLTTEETSDSGRRINLSKDLFKRAFDLQPRRLVISMYNCMVTVAVESSRFVYSLINKRQGRVKHSDVLEGSSSWNVVAYLPVVESLNFADELRRQTAGEAEPQLFFSHWETLPLDPFWEPATVEELGHFGEKADSANIALHYMNIVRGSKGLKQHGKKVVEAGEKQRTLTKNK